MAKVLLYRNVHAEEGGDSALAGIREIGEDISQALAQRAVAKGFGEYLEEVATDSAAEAAAEKGVDITKVQGSGSGGRVTKQDVEKAADKK